MSGANEVLPIGRAFHDVLQVGQSRQCSTLEQSDIVQAKTGECCCCAQFVANLQFGVPTLLPIQDFYAVQAFADCYRRRVGACGGALNVIELKHCYTIDSNAKAIICTNLEVVIASCEISGAREPEH